MIVINFLALSNPRIVDDVHDNQWLNDWARAYLEYYEDTPVFTGIPLASLDQEIITKLNLMVNNIKTE